MAAAGTMRASALLALLFIANTVVAGSKYRGPIEVRRGHAFNITCTVGINDEVSWTKDGKALNDALRPFSETKNVVNETMEATLRVESADWSHAGGYQCSALHAEQRHSVRLMKELTVTGVYEDGYPGYRFLDMGRKSFSLTCNVTEPKTTPFIVNWFKGNETVGNSTLAGRYTLVTNSTSSTITIMPPHDTDNGTYVCVNEGVRAEFEVVGKPYAKLHPNHNVVEGQKVKIVCTIIGRPWPVVTWLYDNGTAGNVSLDGAERVNFTRNEQGVDNTVLVLRDAVPGDYGKYYCLANSTVGGMHSAAVTTLRVKDKYAALWPFIGICAEVVVLCAIILIYEKRRSKNTDMDDSDTDNHDQKKS